MWCSVNSLIGAATRDLACGGFVCRNLACGAQVDPIPRFRGRCAADAHSRRCGLRSCATSPALPSCRKNVRVRSECLKRHVVNARAAQRHDRIPDRLAANLHACTESLEASYANEMRMRCLERFRVSDGPPHMTCVRAHHSLPARHSREILHGTHLVPVVLHALELAHARILRRAPTTVSRRCVPEATIDPRSRGA